MNLAYLIGGPGGSSQQPGTCPCCGFRMGLGGGCPRAALALGGGLSYAALSGGMLTGTASALNAPVLWISQAMFNAYTLARAKQEQAEREDQARRRDLWLRSWKAASEALRKNP